MREYWLTQYILAAVGWGYLGLTAIALAIALWLPTGKITKAVAALIVVGLACVLPIRGYRGYLQEKQATEEYKQRYAKAKALFDERCKTAGEQIYSTAENVDGVRLLNVRPTKIDTGGQFTLDDQYGHEVGGLGYVASFLRPTGNPDLAGRSPYLGMPGYRFIETTYGDSTKRYVKVFKIHPNGDPYPDIQEVNTFSNFTTRYAVQYEDISTHQDRENWIAGGSIKIIDVEKDVLIAERIGFLFDTGLGNTNGGRTPWSWARHYAPACPSVFEHNQIFVFRVLKPTKGE